MSNPWETIDLSDYENHMSLESVYQLQVLNLAECKRRYIELGDVFETICADLLEDDLQLPCSELLVANLLIEYIGYECFQKIIRLVKPLYVSCIIQINAGDSFVSDSPYIHAFDCLEEVHHQMEESDLVDCMSKISYQIKKTTAQLLPNGKKLVRLDFAH